MRASAAFPGGIPPKRLLLGDVRYEFQPTDGAAVWQVTHTTHREFGKYRPRLLFLADGGVWNNLGTQAIVEDRLFHGLKEWGPARSSFEWKKPEWTLFVANASAPMRAANLWRLHIPILAEIAALTRSLNTLNSNTVEPRIQTLRQRRQCAVISIADVSNRAYGTGGIGSFQRMHPDDEELAAMPDANQELWTWAEMRYIDGSGYESLAWHCSSIPTALGRIARADAVALMVHAYQNAQGELYSQGFPRPRPRPSLERFFRLIPRRGRETDSLSARGKL